MGFRRRTRRRALIAGAAVAHHRDSVTADEQRPAYDEAPEPAQPQYAPPPADPADEIEHYAKLHESGALSDEEFAAAKAKVLGQ
jgi:Short C-terminal domain